MKSRDGCAAFSINEMFLFGWFLRIPIGILFVISGAFVAIKGREMIHVTTLVSNTIFISFCSLFMVYHIILFNNRNFIVDVIVFSVFITLSAFASHRISK